MLFLVQFVQISPLSWTSVFFDICSSWPLVLLALSLLGWVELFVYRGLFMWMDYTGAPGRVSCLSSSQKMIALLFDAEMSRFCCPHWDSQFFFFLLLSLSLPFLNFSSRRQIDTVEAKERYLLWAVCRNIV